MTPEEFIHYIGDAAGKICAEYNLPASVCIAQAALESGWGQYMIGHCNYFGRKWGGWGEYVTQKTSEYLNGEWVIIYDKFQSYTSLEDAIKDWCVLMREEPAYRDALNTWYNTFNIPAFVYAMAPVYATDPDYADKIMATIRANTLCQYDGWRDGE